MSKFFQGALTAAVLAIGAMPAQAQAPYPNQAVKWVVPFSPGGLPDTVARIVGLKLQERLGQSVVVENRPGAGGNVAAAAIMGIPADGYTLMVTDGSMFTINPKLMKQLTYDPDKDFVPVVQLARGPLFLAVHPKLPVSTFKEFIDYARANPGKINYGSSGLGTTHHLTMEAVKAALKLDMAHVPFKGTGQSVPALLGGHVDVAFSAFPSLAGAVQGKQVKLVATNGLKRSADAPDVPDQVADRPQARAGPDAGRGGRAVGEGRRGIGGCWSCRLRQGAQGRGRPRRGDGESGKHPAAIVSDIERGKGPRRGLFLSGDARQATLPASPTRVTRTPPGGM